MEGAFTKLEEVASQLMKALEIAFELPEGAFVNKITKEGNASEARLNHYPAIDIQEIKRGGTNRIWPHFDLGVITLLFQDSVGGLEFEDREKGGSFVEIEPGDRAEMIVNVSETLQRWTNGVLSAGLHRVNPPKEVMNKEAGLVPERFSVAYFCKANREASVGPLPEFVRDGQEANYEGMPSQL